MVDPTLPVVLLAFASSEIRGYELLPRLREEANALHDLLTKVQREDLCQLVELRDITLDKLLEVLQDDEYRKRITLLHFGGHGDAYNLLLEDVNRQPLLANAGGLAAFLAGLPGLQLVFLNACSTIEQAEALHRAGVPAIVATSNNIVDDDALEFAKRFYNGLGQNKTISASYDDAAASMLLHNSDGQGLLWHLSCTSADACEWKLADGPRMGPPPACPYPGMRPFSEEERSRFYGRESEVRQAVEMLRRYPFLAVIGASGSGKTSLLSAGILPTLQESHYFANKNLHVMQLRPGIDPTANLAYLFGLDTETVAAGPGDMLEDFASSQLLLVIDPYEEVFSVGNLQVVAFEEAIQHLMRQPNVLLVIAARADFYPNLMDSALWPQIQDHRLELTRLHGDDLRQAIMQPAEDADVVLAPLLVEQLVADAGAEPGVLPFVQEALVMVWSHMHRRHIDLAAYLNIVGDNSRRTGLEVAMAEHANHVYRDVLANDEERSIARRIFLRLIQFGEGRPDTRRQQTEADLRSADDVPAVFDTTLRQLVKERLLTSNGDAANPSRTIDVAHEALLTGWPLLHQWIEEGREAEKTRRRLQARADEWIRLGGKIGGLLDAVELPEARRWLESANSHECGISEELRRFFASSREHQDQIASDKRRELERAQQQARRLIVLLVLLSVLVLLAAASVVDAWVWRARSEERGRVAIELLATVVASDKSYLAANLGLQATARAIAPPGISLAFLIQPEGVPLTPLPSNLAGLNLVSTNGLPPSKLANDKLAVGKRAGIRTGFRTFVRSEPGSDSGEVIGYLQDGDVVEIIGGPYWLQGDSDTIVWWYVETQSGQRGWVPANTSQFTLLNEVK